MVNQNYVFSKINTVIEEGASVIVVGKDINVRNECESQLLKNNYDIKTVDRTVIDNSLKRPRFNYIESKEYILELVNYIVKKRNDNPFFMNAVKLLLEACITYSYEVNGNASPWLEDTKRVLYDVITNPANIRKLDDMFGKLAKKSPSSPAVMFYDAFKRTSGAAIAEIVYEAHSLLNTFQLEETLCSLVGDKGFLTDINQRKTAIFVVLPEEIHNADAIGALISNQLVQKMFEQNDAYESEGQVSVKLFFNDGMQDIVCSFQYNKQ